MIRKFTFLLLVLMALFASPGWAEVQSGHTYETKAVSSLPQGWTGSGSGSQFIQLTTAENYIATDQFNQYGFTSIVLKARKYGGPSEAQATITVSWYDAETSTETVLGTIIPTSTTLTNYTISSPTNPEVSTDGFIKIQCKNAGSGKGSGISEVTINYVASTPSSDPSGTYTLVTDASSLQEGDIILLGCSSKGKAAGPMGSSAYFTSVDGVFNNNAITSDNAIEFTLGGNSGAWTLTSNEGLIGTTAAKSLNHDGDGTTTWIISISSGNADIQSTTPSYGAIQYNASNPRFLNYVSGQTAIQIYKKNILATNIATPTFSVVAGTYTSTQSVEITCATTGAMIYYTTDGTTPTHESMLYTGAFNVEQTTTIKAIAYLNGEASNVATAIYTLLNRTIAQAQSGATDTEVYVEGTVMAVCSTGAVIGDTTGYILLYNVNHNLSVGDVVSIQGVLGNYGGFKQFTSSATVVVTGSTQVTYPTPITMLGRDMDAWLDAPVIQYASYTGRLTQSGNYINVSVDGADDAIGSVGQSDIITPAMNNQVVAITGFTMYKSGSRYIYTIPTNAEIQEVPVYDIVIPSELSEIITSDADQNKAYESQSVKLGVFITESQKLTSLSITGSISGENVQYTPALSMNVDEYTFTMPAENVTIDATVVDKEIYELYLSVSPTDAGIAVDAETENFYYENDQVVVTALSNNGYTFVNWTENGAEVSTEAEYTFNITSDRELVANFREAANYTVSFSTGNSEISDPADITVTEGSDMTLPTVNVSQACSDNGWTFAGWTETAVETETGNTPTLYTTTYLPTASTTLYAVYRQGEAGSQDSCTLNLATADQITEATETSLVFTNSPVTFSVSKGESSTNANNYCPVSSTVRTSTRVYGRSNFTISAGSDVITSVVITAASENYANNLSGFYWTNATASVSATTVTLTPSENATTVSCAVDATAGMTSIVVNYSTPSTLVYSSNPDCEQHYTITLIQPQGGTVEASETDAAEGAMVSLNATADEDYVLDHWEVTDLTGASITVENNTFEMPAGDVIVTAVFRSTIINGKWTLVKSETSLAEGDKVVIVALDEDYAMSTMQNTSNRGQVEINKNAEWNTVTTPDGIQKITLEAGSVESTFALNTGNGYLYAASSSSNQLKTQAEIDTNASWTISITSGNALLTANGGNQRNTMRYNSTNNIFSCYAPENNQADIALYKFVPYTVFFNDGTGMCATEFSRASLDDGTVAIPDASVPNNTAYTLAGWSTSPVNETTSVPTPLYRVGDSYTPETDIHLYAVYESNGTYNSFPTGVRTQLNTTEGFENYTDLQLGKTRVKPTNWTAVPQNPQHPELSRPQVSYSTYPYYVYDGVYSLLMDSLYIMSMPKLDDNIQVSDLQMEIYVRQAYDIHQLEVGVMTDLTDPTSFEMVASLNNLGDGFNRRVVDFSSYTGAGRYIAFKNVNSDNGVFVKKSFNYIDEITLTESTSNTCGITQLPYENDFEEETGAEPACWQLANRDQYYADTYMPKIAHSSSYANSGSNTLLLDGRCIYVMPELKVENVNVTDLQLDFYVKQYSAASQLEVGVLSDLNDANTFVSVATVSNGGSSTQQRHTVDFSSYQGTGKYIAFRNVYEGTWARSPQYIDDISLHLADNCGITSLPYSDDFESITLDADGAYVEPDCWQVARYDVNLNATYSPHVVGTAYYANSGNNSLQMDGRCYYAMPEMKVENIEMNQLQLEFYVRQYSAACKLEVGVMSDLNDVSTFKTVAVIDNGARTYQQYHKVDFSAYDGDGKYVVFHNVYDGTWGRSPQYIDDINLSVRQADNCGITALPYTNDFENESGTEPECWQLAQLDVNIASTYNPHIVSTAYYAHSGNNSLLLDGRCIYVMPELRVENTSVNQLQLDFYVRQYSSACKLEVGVMSDLNDATTFVPVSVISNEGASSQQFHSVDFSSYTGAGKYVAFRNVYEGTWGRSPQYIDDITLSIATPETRLAENEQVSEEVETVEETEETASYDNEDNFSLLTREPEVTVYPNPTTGNLHFAAMENVEKVEVFNNIGRLMATFNNQREINISDMPAGLYMLRVTLQGDAVVMKKVVKK